MAPQVRSTGGRVGVPRLPCGRGGLDFTIKARYEKIILCGEVKTPPGVYIIGRVRHAAVEWQFSCYLKYWARVS